MKTSKKYQKSLLETISEAVNLASAHLQRFGTYQKLEIYKALLIELKLELDSSPDQLNDSIVANWKLRSQQTQNELLFQICKAIENRQIGLIPVWATVLIAGRLYRNSKPSLGYSFKG